MGFLSLHASKEMHIDGVIEVYNIGTYKQSGDTRTLDADALSFGGQLGVTTADFHGWYGAVDFMTTNGLFINSDPSRVDGSVLSNNVWQQSGKAADKANNITIIGEAYVGFHDKTKDLKVGRQKYESPLASTKEVRELPSTFSGVAAAYKSGGLTFGLAAFDSFKQRTSDAFYNILEHALGVNTELLTGHKEGELLTSKLIYKNKRSTFSLHEYYMEDFMNSVYVGYERKIGTTKLELQGLHQQSIGYFSTALEQGLVNSKNYEEGLFVSSVGAKVTFGSKKDSFILATTYTGSKKNAYSDIVTAFDGTPLFTDSITGNNLFRSWYGNALSSDSGYTADTLSFKAAYKHKLSAKVNSMFAVARFDQALGGVAQTDINAVLSWKTHGWDLAAKAIYVFDDAQVAGNKLQQYRLIATYKFHK